MSQVSKEAGPAERPVPVAEAMRGLLDQIEEGLDENEKVGPRPPDALFLPSEIKALDRLCGGLRRGGLTLIEAAEHAQAQAVIYTAARYTRERALLAVESLLDTSGWLVAGISKLPAVIIRERRLSAADWNEVDLSTRWLAIRRLKLTEASSPERLEAVLEQQPGRLLLVHDAGRFGEPVTVMPWLHRLAETTGLAIMATSPPVGSWARESLKGVTRVAMVPHRLASRASLVLSDTGDRPGVEEVDVDLLIAQVSEPIRGC